MAKVKVFKSPGYNYVFDMDDGKFIRWGETLNDNPQMSPYGPEIADIEISVGDCLMACPWCYKSNDGSKGTHMNADMFRKILGIMPSTLTQVALGITDPSKHPHFIKILEICRERGVVPNYTTSGVGMREGIIDATVKLCGAVAVSVYTRNEGTARYFAHKLRRRGMEQVNAHLLYMEENFEFVKGVLKNPPDVNAVVLLGLKQRGRGSSLTPLPTERFAELIDVAMENGTKIGFDSCSAHKYEAWARENGMEHTLIYCEPCESTLFSVYIDVHGYAHPCSFTEDEMSGIPVFKKTDFISEVWNSPRFQLFRSKLLFGRRHCPAYEV